MNVTGTFSFLFAVMLFARSVVLHFPAEIHRAKGVSEVAPQLPQALDVEKIAALQFLKNGQVCVTPKTAEYRDDLLEGSTFLFGDVPIPVTAADQPTCSVFVRDLPFEVPDCDVKSAFESFVSFVSSPFISVSFVISRLWPMVLVVSYCLFVVLSRRLYTSLISLYVCFMLVNLSFVPFVTN